MKPLSPEAKTVLERYRQAQTWSDAARARALESLQARIAAGQLPSIPLEDVTPPPQVPHGLFGKLFAAPLAKVGLGVALALGPAIWLVGRQGDGVASTEVESIEHPQAAPAGGSPAPFLPKLDHARAEARALEESKRASVKQPEVVEPSAASRPPASHTLDLVDQEVSLLRAAHVALQSGRTGEALARLSEHGRRFPSSKLSDSREATRVFALCAGGQERAARALAQEFLRTWPRSPLAAKVRDSCGDAR